MKGTAMTYTLEDFQRDRRLDRAEIDARKTAMRERMRLYDLKEARTGLGMTQKALADRMGVSQKRVSVLESGDVDRAEIRTLRRYMQAIGGELHVSAALPDGRVLQLV